MRNRIVLLLHDIGDWFTSLAERLQYGMSYAEHLRRGGR